MLVAIRMMKTMTTKATTTKKTTTKTTTMKTTTAKKTTTKTRSTWQEAIILLASAAACGNAYDERQL